MTLPRRALRLALVILVLAVAVISLMTVIPQLRAGAARGVLSVALATKSLHLTRGDLALDARGLTARDISISNSQGHEIFGARRVDVRYAVTAHGVVVSSVVLDAPHVTASRRADGTFDLVDLLGGRGAGQSTSPLDLSISDGFLHLLNDQSPARAGRSVSVDHINGGVRLRPGSMSRGGLTAELVTGGTSVPVRAKLYENDASRIARAMIEVRGAPLAPPVDLFTSSKAFVVESGTADMNLTAFAIGWTDNAGPAWHVVGSGYIREGCIRALPLVAAVCGLDAPVNVSDGMVLFPAIKAVANGIPLHASGLVAFAPTAGLDLDVRARAQMSKVRGLLAFSRAMPLSGRVAMDVKIRGAPASPHADLRLHAPHGLAYGAVPVTSFASDAYYHDGHVTILSAGATYDGASLFGNGDIDLTSAPVSAQFVSLTRADANRLPLFSQLATNGTVRAAAAFAGPLAQLSGEGFADVRGGSTALRAIVEADPATFELSAIAKDRHGASLFAGAHIGRAQDAASSVDLVASHFTVESAGRTVGLPGIVHATIALPHGSFNADGAGAMLGTLAVPLARVAIKLDDVRMTSHPTGSGATYPAITSLARASLRGVLVGRSWIGDGAAWGARMRIAGTDDDITLQAMAASVGDQIHVYGATAQIAGGQVAFAGTLPGARPGDLVANVSHVDAAALAPFGAPALAGTITAFAHITGTRKAPRVSLQGTITDGVIAGRAVSGDGTFRLAGGDLQIVNARVTTADTMAYVRGTIRDAVGARSSSPQLDVRATLPNVDIASVSSSYDAGSAAVAGLADADVRIGGTLGDPKFSGTLTSGIGTVRGVTYDDLQATVSGSSGALDIQNASVNFGSSRLVGAGSIAPASTALRIASPRVRLDDFNDFFNGKDVLEGHGSMAFAMDSSGGALQARGGAHLRDVVVQGVPAGAVDLKLSRAGDATVASLHQHNDIASVDLRTTITPVVTSSSGLRDFAAARYAVDGQIRRADFAAIAPYVSAEDQRLTGILNGEVHASGSLHAPVGSARFAITRGSVRGIALDDVRAELATDGRFIQLRTLRARGQRMTIVANGRMDRVDRTVALRVHASVADLATAARLANISGPAHGSATFDGAAFGVVSDPVIDVHVVSANGELHGVSFDGANVVAHYSGRRLRAAGTVAFARGRGTLDVAGTLPVGRAPLGVGPNDQKISLRARTTGVGLGVVDPLLGGAAQVSGALDSDITVKGTAAQPVVAGWARLRNGVVASRYDTIGARSVNADLFLANHTISLRDLRATLGAGGLTAHGDAHVVAATAQHRAPSLRFALQTSLAGAQVDIPDLVKGEVTGSVAVTKSDRRIPDVTGNLTLSNTAVPFATLLALASHGSAGPSESKNVPGVPAPLPGRVTAYAGSLFGTDFTLVQPPVSARRHASTVLHIPHSARLDLHVTASKDVGVTGAISAMGTGTIDVTGTTRAPKLAGALTAVRGRASFVNTRFELTDGFVTFDPSDGLLPTIEAAATTSTDTADITVTIAGRVDQLHTEFSSTPEMSRDAIVATLLHIPQINSALASSHGQTQSQFGVNPQDVVTGAVAGQVLGALNAGLNQLFDIGEANIQLDRSGSPGLEVRHPFGPHAYTVYKTTFSVPPAQSFGVAYVVRRALSVEFTQSQATPGTSPVSAPPLTSIQVNIAFH